MRILVTGFTANYGGVETFIMNYYRYMKQLDSELIIDIASMASEPAFKSEIEKLGGKVWHISRGRNKIQQRKDLRNLMNSEMYKYDVLWCNKCELSDITILKVAAKSTIPVRIIHSHNSQNMYDGLKQKIVNVLHNRNKKSVYQYVTEYWSCSDYAAKWLFTPDISEKEQYTFVPNAVDCEKFRYQESIRDEYRTLLDVEDKLVIGCVGRFSYQKNPEFTLEIFREINKKDSNAILIWVGIGELQEQIQNKIMEYGLEDKVKLLGVRQDVDKIMQAMDCMLLPSRFEGLPVVAVEAQAVGLQVFAAREGITEQTKITDKFQFLSLEQSPEMWANEILKSKLEHEDMYEQIVEQGFEIKIAAENLLKKLGE